MKKAQVRWNKAENRWDIGIQEADGSFVFSSGWMVMKGIAPTGEVIEGVDFINDQMLCEIAKLTDLGYTIEYKLG